MSKKTRSVIFYKSYFESFFLKLDEKTKKKIIWTINLIEEIKHVPEPYLKHIKGTDGLYEVRIQTGNNIYRVFCIFDQDKLVVLMNGFQKKSQKTPKNEIEKALKIRYEYEQEK